MTKEYISNLLQELQSIVSLAGKSSFNHAHFNEKIYAIQEAIAQEQYLNDFIEYHRNGLEISQEFVEQKRDKLQKVILDENIRKNDKILAIYKEGNELLLVAVLLLFQNRVQLTIEHSTQLHQTLNILKLIPNIQQFGYIDPKILESLCISAWHVGEFWLIAAIADLDLHFYHSVELKKAREAAYQLQNIPIFIKLTKIISPSDKAVYIEQELTTRKNDLSKILNNTEVFQNTKQFTLMVKCAQILIAIAQISCPEIEAPIATHEEQITRFHIQELKILTGRLLKNNSFNTQDIQCLTNAALHLREIWIINLMLQHQLLLQSNILTAQCINHDNMAIIVAQHELAEKTIKEQEALAKAEEQRVRQEQEALAKAEEQRVRQEQEALAKAEEQRVRQEQEALAKAEEQRVRQEQEALAKAEEQRVRQEQEALAKAEEQRVRQEQEALAKSEEQRVKREQEALAKAEEQRVRQEQEALAKAEEQRVRQEQEALARTKELKDSQPKEDNDTKEAEDNTDLNNSGQEEIDDGTRRALARKKREQDKKEKQAIRKKEEQQALAKAAEERAIKEKEALAIAEEQRAREEKEALIKAEEDRIRKEQKEAELAERKKESLAKKSLKKKKALAKAAEEKERKKEAKAHPGEVVIHTQPQEDTNTSNELSDIDEMQDAVDKLDQEKVMELLADSYKYSSLLDAIIAEKIIHPSDELADFITKIPLTIPTSLALITYSGAGYKTRMALGKKIAHEEFDLSKYLSSKTEITDLEIINDIRLTSRAYFILFASDAVHFEMKLAIIKKILSKDFPTSEYFPLNKIFNIKDKCKDFFKDIPNIEERKGLARALIEKEIGCNDLIQDHSECSMHHFMRHIPNDFEILDMIIRDYEKLIKQDIEKGIRKIAIHPVNKKKQNYLHVLAEYEYDRDIAKTLSRIKDYGVNVISAIFFKDENQLSPANILECRETYPLDTIEFLNQNTLCMIGYLLLLANNICINEMQTIADMYGNLNTENVITYLFKQRKIERIKNIITQRFAFRVIGVYYCLEILAKKGFDLDGAEATKALETLKLILGSNEYSVIVIEGEPFINKILTLAEDEPAYEQDTDEIVESYEFKEALKIQPITETLVWSTIIDKIKHGLITNFEEIYRILKEYLEFAKSDPNISDKDELNILDKFILLGGTTLTKKESNLNGLKLCCENLSVTVQERHLINQACGSYQNEKFSAEVLEYLLEKFNDKTRALNIGSQEDRDLLVYATLGAQSPAMIRTLIKYGFNANKKYVHLGFNLILIILNSYYFGKINHEKIIPILNACLDDNLLSKKEQIDILQHLEQRLVPAIIYLFFSPKEHNDINEQIVTLFISKGINIFQYFEIVDQNKIDFNEMILLSKNAHIIKIIFDAMEEKRPGFVKKYLNNPDKKGKSIIDKLDQKPVSASVSQEVIELLKSYKDIANTSRAKYKA